MASPNPTPGVAGLTIAACKLLEHGLPPAPQVAPAPLSDTDTVSSSSHCLGGQNDLTAGRRVFRGILQQIHQDPFDQQRIEAHQRQIARQAHLDMVQFQTFPASRPAPRLPPLPMAAIAD